jgi:hypothetical protein
MQTNKQTNKQIKSIQHANSGKRMIKQTNNRHPLSILLYNVFVGKIRQNNADNRITDMETKDFSRRGTF